MWMGGAIPLNESRWPSGAPTIFWPTRKFVRLATNTSSIHSIMSIPASVPPPVPRGFQGKGGRSKRDANLLKYGTPLPILLPSSPLHPDTTSRVGHIVDPAQQKEPAGPIFAGLGVRRRAVVPAIVGVLDADTGSVWVDGEGMEVLFNRGFFGKGTLSRSDPSWRKRRVELVRGGDAVVAEQIREKRRLERKQFKIDRAAAMLDAAKKAEAVLTTGQLPGADAGAGAEAAEDSEDDDDDDGEKDRPASPAASAISLATTASVLPDGTKLNAQTFLVRPQRPESAGNNRNRGKFKRRPPGKPAAPGPGPGAGGASASPAEKEKLELEVAAKPTVPTEAWEEDADALALVPDHEHLQLCLEEAWFLSALGVLSIESESGTLIPASAVLTRLLTPLPPSPLSDSLSSPSPAARAQHTPLYPDDPFLVSYAAYHHYRSLGWCVRHGIKFAVDWLLYRRGPVFSHSAFSVLLVPVYMDEGDRAGPHGQTDWYAEKTSWKWINTVMRVNSLVQKTVILAYVTIPALSSFPDSARLPGGGLDPRKFDMRSLMSRYTVREVSLTRFSAARRRD
ncbi:hypothetical protein CC85DRAFT_112550 [Cutaneotrichosporon oleaginosum]|uniref:tRNA-intron lyase n=1 Tax=Cutaneotrichosporon oleaginosum TaxID=879819 RepID=A0A0J0XX31_9TREE|nr:uncharacterized protein CC85DRAFT_112550 [Cutaneotrichosporon oleaginosum]KLT45632.1 hypothetical protein CC85DRAFT_112550 [Cutaneotrichosporon oleaginosum]TXT04574.1 hypothetical protein COLE_07393 [Cutaneotrichosporon oleaginosum]